MAIYDGVVTLSNSDVPVIVELDEGHVRLSASGTEIGLWPADECQITPVDDTTFAITAEDETLQFVPNQPTLFAAALNGGSHGEGVHTSSEPAAGPTGDDGVREAPPPRPLTRALFIALCAVTVALAAWSLVAILG